MKSCRGNWPSPSVAGKRQAAPFSKGRRSSNPRRPGRKPGTGLFSYRKPPSPDEITEPVVEVAVSVEVCPGCGGRLEDEGMGVAYVTDIPPIRRPQVTSVPGAGMPVPVLRQAGPRPAIPMLPRTSTGPAPIGLGGE